MMMGESVTVRDFLVIINNLGLILHSFRDVAT